MTNSDFNIDIEALRQSVKEYYNDAGLAGFPAAFIEALSVDNMTDEEVILRANRIGIDVEKYQKRRFL